MEYHYTYKLQIDNKYYYGVRTSRDVPPECDILHDYFSSSPVVKELLNEGHSCIATVDKVFSAREQANDYEGEYLKAIPKEDRGNWLNKNFGRTGNYAVYGVATTDEKKRKISIANKGKVRSAKHRRAMGDALSLALKGKPKTEEHKRKLSESLKKRWALRRQKQRVIYYHFISSDLPLFVKVFGSIFYNLTSRP